MPIVFKRNFDDEKRGQGHLETSGAPPQKKRKISNATIENTNKNQNNQNSKSNDNNNGVKNDKHGKKTNKTNKKKFGNENKKPKNRKDSARQHYFQRKSKQSGNEIGSSNEFNKQQNLQNKSKHNKFNKNKNDNHSKNNNKSKKYGKKKGKNGSKTKNKDKEKSTNENNNDNEKMTKKKSKSLATQNIPIETLTGDQQAIVFEKLFLETLKLSMLESEFKFDSKHFHCLNKINNSSIDTIHSFLIDHYATATNEDNKEKKEKKESETENENENKESSNLRKDKKCKDEKKKADWVAYTKTMQCLVIASSVQEAVQFVKGLKDIQVNHCFLHKKQVKKMEKYANYENENNSYNNNNYNNSKYNNSYNNNNNNYNYYNKYDNSYNNNNNNNNDNNNENSANYEDNEAIIKLRICELFGKHRKLSDQIEDLQAKSWHIGVGSANRILKLCESKHLTLKQCEYIFIDCQRNAKQMCMFDMKPIALDVCTFIQKYALDRLKKGKLKIVCI